MQFTEANVETAMCLWEEIQALLRVGYREVHHDNTELGDLAVKLVEEEGTPAARHVVISWVAECEADWERDRASGTELIPYDWEHCPAFVARKLRTRYPS